MSNQEGRSRGRWVRFNAQRDLSLLFNYHEGLKKIRDRLKAKDVQSYNVEHPEVFKVIFEILQRNEFEPEETGMYNYGTGSHFPWQTIADYATVVDFQIEHGYA